MGDGPGLQSQRRLLLIPRGTRLVQITLKWRFVKQVSLLDNPEALELCSSRWYLHKTAVPFGHFSLSARGSLPGNSTDSSSS